MSANNLLEPGNHALLLIDHQYLQLLTLRSHEASQVISNATAVAKAAKIFKVPTLLTTAFAERQTSSRRSRTSSPSNRRSTAPRSTAGKTSGWWTG